MPRVGPSRLVACLPLLGFAATYVTLRSGFPGLYVWPVHLAAPLVVAVFLAGLMRSRWVPVLLQALVFGVLHYGGTSVPGDLYGVDILVFGVLLASA